MKKVIDIHSHVIPHVDDGCQSLSEALQMLALYDEQDVEAVICTPHFGVCGIPFANVSGWYKKLTNATDKLYLGNEVLYTDTTVSDLDSGRARTLAFTDHALIEFEEWSYSTSARDMVLGLLKVKSAGYVPVLAHPERYKCLQAEPQLCKKIAAAGIEMQVNAYDIDGNSNPRVVRTARYLLRNQIATYLGSDAHGRWHRPPALKDGVAWIYANCPEDYADAVVHDNAQKLLKGEA